MLLKTSHLSNNWKFTIFNNPGETEKLWRGDKRPLLNPTLPASTLKVAYLEPQLAITAWRYKMRLNSGLSLQVWFLEDALIYIVLNWLQSGRNCFCGRNSGELGRPVFPQIAILGILSVSSLWLDGKRESLRYGIWKPVFSSHVLPGARHWVSNKMVYLKIICK